MYCLSCGSDAVIEYNSAAGNSVCTGCGTVLEESSIVAEVTFGETSGGAAIVQGSYVGADQTRARRTGGYRHKGPGESREQTLLNGRRFMQELSVGLKLSDRLADAGQRYFNLAVNMNFVQGRRTQYVSAACLYAACRMNKTQHMLIDFSDILQINVFVLGSTYLKLIKELSIQLPTVDPSIYISRFAALLEFGDETQKVAQDATRLVARMGRDWMHIGRRPSGVCGACLLLAARMNNFRRSVEEVVQVVKIADTTLRKRLDEFRETASGTLTVNDFRSVWLDESNDPPAFSRVQKQEQIKREKLEKKQRKLREASVASTSTTDTAHEAAAAFLELGQREAEDDEESLIPPEERRATSAVPPDQPRYDNDGFAIPPLPSSRPSTKVLGKRRERDDDDTDADTTTDGGGAGDEDSDDDEDDSFSNNPLFNDVIAHELSETLTSESGRALAKELDLAEARRMSTAASIDSLKHLRSSEEDNSLEGLDEEELDQFILTDEEAEIKARLWMEFNKDYLQALADRQTGPDGQLKPLPKYRPRKKHVPRDSTTALGTSAGDSTRQMLQKKKFSKNINYAAIEGLFSSGTSDAGSTYGDGDEGAALIGSRSATPTQGGRAGSPWSTGSRMSASPASFRRTSMSPSPARVPTSRPKGRPLSSLARSRSRSLDDVAAERRLRESEPDPYENEGEGEDGEEEDEEQGGADAGDDDDGMAEWRQRFGQQGGDDDDGYDEA